jgi:hypothetical protein
MNSIRISASLMDEWINARAGKHGIDGERLRNRILRTEPPNAAMLRGSAYHEIIEKGTAAFWQPDPLLKVDFWGAIRPSGAMGPEGIPDYYEPADISTSDLITVRVFDDRIEEDKKYCDIQFTVGAVIPAMKAHERYQDGVHEVWNTQERTVKGWNVVTNQRYDQLIGATHIEYKTTGSQPSWIRYFESIQWKVYQAGLPEVSETVYQVFQLGKNNDWCKESEYRFPREDHEAHIRSVMEELIVWLEKEPECLEALMIQ